MYRRLCVFMLAFVMLLSTVALAMASTVKVFEGNFSLVATDTPSVSNVPHVNSDTTLRGESEVSSETTPAVGLRSLSQEILQFSTQRVRFDFYVGSFADFTRDRLTPSRHAYVMFPSRMYLMDWGDICATAEELIPQNILRHFPSSYYFYPVLENIRGSERLPVFRFHVEPKNNLTVVVDARTSRFGDIGFFDGRSWPRLYIDGFRCGQIVTLDELVAIVQSKTDFSLELYGTPRFLNNRGADFIIAGSDNVWWGKGNIVEIYFPMIITERTLTFYVFEFSKESTLSTDATETARGSFTTTLNVPASLKINFSTIATLLETQAADYYEYWRSEFPLYEARYVGEETVFLVFWEGACPRFGGTCRCGTGDVPPDVGIPPCDRETGGEIEEVGDTSTETTAGPKTGDSAAPPYVHIAVLSALVAMGTSIALVRGSERGVRKGNRLGDKLINEVI